MALNETQLRYLGGIRRSDQPTEQVTNDFADAKSQGYLSAPFRELLFAIDATNTVAGDKWHRIYPSNMVRYAGWVVDRKLTPSAFVELGELASVYGVGAYTLELIVALMEQTDDRPNNAESFVRRIFREHFTGIQPVTGLTLFLMKRYFEPRRPLGDLDVDLLLHITEETKGLSNDPGVERYVATVLSELVTPRDAERNPAAERRIVRWLTTRDEVRPAEKMLMEMLKANGVVLPESLQQYLDLSMDQLMGLA